MRQVQNIWVTDELEPSYVKVTRFLWTFYPPQCLMACFVQLSFSWLELSKGFFVERLPNMSHSVEFRTHEIISNSMISSRLCGAELLEALQYVRMWVDSDSEPREPACFVESQWVSSGPQPYCWCQQPDSLQTHTPGAGRGSPCPPPSRAGWFLPALAALHSTHYLCDFLWFPPRASRRGTIPLLRARIGHSHLDLNVSGCVVFRICSLLKLTLKSDQNSQMTYTVCTRLEQLPSPAFGALKGETHHDQLGWTKV